MAKKDSVSLEEQLWSAADKLRADSGLKASQYATPVLGLIFLRFVSIKYDKYKAEIEAEYKKSQGGRNAKHIEDIALAKVGYYLPDNAHFDYLLSLPESDNIPKAIKDAMESIERYKPELVGSLPKDEYMELVSTSSEGDHDSSLVKALLKNISNIPADISGDVFGKVYEYFLGKFALKEGQGGGEFFTPTSVVRLMVEMIEPYGGLILDPACGSGGMFVQSADFVKEHRKAYKDTGEHELVVHGVEKEKETVKIARMNMFLNGLRNEIVNANSYYDDPFDTYGHFDYVMANPPFNVDDVNLDKVKCQKRFSEYGIPQNNRRRLARQRMNS
jgi:type I restriction enzyme M protein